MNKKERVDAALRGEPIDRIPASMWGHDFERDWKRLRHLEPERGALGEQLRALQIINHAIGYDAYFVQTIFCPLGVAKYLVGNKNEPVLQTIREDRSAMHAALRVINET